jgi:hypothetical protein
VAPPQSRLSRTLIASDAAILSTHNAPDRRLWRVPDSRTSLESAVSGFESLQGIQQLQHSFAQWTRSRGELLRVIDGKPPLMRLTS